MMMMMMIITKIAL